MAATTRLDIELLEDRSVPTANAVLSMTGFLTVLGGAGRDHITIAREGAQIVVRDSGVVSGQFSAAAVTGIGVDAAAGDDSVRIASNVTVPAALIGGSGRDILVAGGGATQMIGGTGNDKLGGGPNTDVMLGDGGRDRLIGRGNIDALDGEAGPDKIASVEPIDALAPDPLDTVSFAVTQAPDPMAMPPQAAVTQLNAGEVSTLLDRASAATASNDGIIAIVDRNGTIMGVRVEGGVDPGILADPTRLAFAIDGAVAKARTAAFFASDAAPLTSRTIESLSQTTITEREVNSNPNIPDLNSVLRGPGFVAPVHTGGHFPPGIANTPQVDLFAIQHTNRDSIKHPGKDHIKGTIDDITLPNRFNIDPTFVPAGQSLRPPESYGFQSGTFVNAQSRGIATLPGGIPIFKKTDDGTSQRLVGGIGVFYPGRTGFATEENSELGTTFDRTKPDRSLEAEFAALAAVGGAPGLEMPIGSIAGIAPLANIILPITFEFQRIDLVGITLDIIGPNGTEGPRKVVENGQSLGQGIVTGFRAQVLPGGQIFAPGAEVPEGWLVTPHDGVGVTAAEATAIVRAGIAQANLTRAAIRLPTDSATRMVLAVADQQGNIVALFRQRDATVFSIDVAVAKARNVMYYADPTQLQPIDEVGVPRGTAFTNRTFRYLAEPFFPEGIDEAPPGPFSIYGTPGSDQVTGRNVGPLVPAIAFQTALGFDAFNPGTNFHQQNFVQNQNGVVFFPGSAPIYRQSNSLLIGGFGISGDGVDQDDVVTFAGSRNFGVPDQLLRADETFVRGVRLPYQKFNRQPLIDTPNG